MKVFPDEAIAAFEDGSAIVSGAVAIYCSDPVFVWGGWGPLMLGDDEYIGVGDRGLAQVNQAALGGVAQGITLQLSGVDRDMIALIDAMDLRGARAVLWRLVFDGTGLNLLAAHVFTRGSVDELPVEDIPGGTSTINVAIESPARGLGRKGGRRRTDADQRLVKPTDGGFKHVAYAAEKQLYWGGQRPASAGSAFGSIFSSVIGARMQNEISG